MGTTDVPAAVVGWDVGGAHLKAAAIGADGRLRFAAQWSCRLWLGLEELVAAIDLALQALRDARTPVGPATRHAVTMTGEMTDAFEDREHGVRGIAQQLARSLPGAAPACYAGASGFVDVHDAARAAQAIASANWHATAALVALRLPDALLLDIGSTTTDVVPVRGGRVAALGVDDASRLQRGELVYTGVVRTPVMAMAAEVAVEGVRTPLIPEYFATSADVHRLLGQLDPRHDQQPAADGGEKSVAASARRLARMVGRDAAGLPLSAWQEIALALHEAQRQRVIDGCRQVLSAMPLPPDAPVVTAGCGAFLAAEAAGALRRRAIGLDALVDAGTAGADAFLLCAPAAAVAMLAFDAIATGTAAAPAPR